MARVVAVSAHPDDESIFGGGTLAKYAAEGHEVIIVCTTRGEGGEVGNPPLCLKPDLGAFREQELRCAAKALGAADVIFLDFVDPAIEIGEPPLAVDATLEEFSAALGAVFEWLHPEVVMTHGSSGEYGHPQHVFTHHAVRTALAGLAPWHPNELLTWQANRNPSEVNRLVNQNDPADLVIDVRPWLEAKIAAMECHRTQHAMFRRNTKKETIREMVGRIEAFRCWPV